MKIALQKLLVFHSTTFGGAAIHQRPIWNFNQLVVACFGVTFFLFWLTVCRKSVRLHFAGWWWWMSVSKTNKNILIAGGVVILTYRILIFHALRFIKHIYLGCIVKPSGQMSCLFRVYGELSHFVD
jgi:hypothetical protein